MIRYRTGEESDLQVNLTPMIDMVFLLIIFFLTATTFTEREREQDVLLPTNRNPGSLSRNSETSVIVNVKEDGTIFVRGARREPADLVAFLRSERERIGPELKVQVRGDGRTSYRNVTRALEAIESAGIPKPYIDTKYAGEIE